METFKLNKDNKEHFRKRLFLKKIKQALVVSLLFLIVCISDPKAIIGFGFIILIISLSLLYIYKKGFPYENMVINIKNNIITREQTQGISKISFNIKDTSIIEEKHHILVYNKVNITKNKILWRKWTSASRHQPGNVNDQNVIYIPKEMEEYSQLKLYLTQK